MPKIIDLTKPVKKYPGDPWWMKVSIRHTSHFIGKLQIRFIGLPFSLFPKGFKGWASDTIKLGVHSVTHMDAPWHFSPEVKGVKSKTIDKIPLEWCYGDGAVLDMTHKKDMELITKEDLQDAVLTSGIKISPGTIVLIRTGRDKLIGTKAYIDSGTGVSAEATEWLIDQGVRVMGIDQWGWDLPLSYQAERIRKGADPETFWEGHRVGCRREYCHIEQIVGLEQLPPSGFKIIALPLPIEGCSASPVRLVAVIED